MAGIEKSGELDDATWEAMQRPRCGNPDIADGRPRARRQKRYALQRSAWSDQEKKDLTYRIRSYPRIMTRANVDTEIDRAFNMWSNVADVTFRRLDDSEKGEARIDLDFYFGDHGDSQPFDGPDGILAHAFFPESGGNIHFDKAETYTYNNTKGKNLFGIASHEIGHSLGLMHSDQPEALMYGMYKGYIPDLKLDQDDIDGVRALYGAPVPPTSTSTTSTTSTTRITTKATTPSTRPTTTRRTTTSTVKATTAPTPPTPATPPGKQPCLFYWSDAALYDVKTDRTYFFSGSYYWRVDDYGAEPGYPRRIWWDWDVPSHLDAALVLANNPTVTYFFKGSHYYKLVNRRRVHRYPRHIGIDGFYGVPSNIDAAFQWGLNENVYFIKGNQFYRMVVPSNGDLEHCRADPGRYTYNRWGGLPSRVNAAIRYKNGKTYFFRNTQYWRLNDQTRWVDRQYPKSILKMWLDCKDPNRE